MVTRTEWYDRVNAAWPADIPALTADEALKAARKLYRFSMGSTFGGKVVLTTGNRYTWVRNYELRVNAARREYVDGKWVQGWIALIHDLSHYAHSRLNPNLKPHCGAQARIEISMIKEVIKRGWLNGTLKTEAKIAKAAPDMRNVRYERICQRIESWERREKRAANALKKLRKQCAYYERTIVKTDSATLH